MRGEQWLICLNLENMTNNRIKNSSNFNNKIPAKSLPVFNNCFFLAFLQNFIVNRTIETIFFQTK